MSTATPARVCIVGGGIAGCGAAWALAGIGRKKKSEGKEAKGNDRNTANRSTIRNNVEVTLIEAQEELGGNAKTKTWFEGPGHESILMLSHAVYLKLLCRIQQDDDRTQRLGVAEKVRLPFLVETYDSNSGEKYVAWDQASPLSSPLVFKKDSENWERLVDWVRGVNSFFGCAIESEDQGLCSMYRSNLLNPLNYISLLTLCRWFSISQDFWEEVIVAVYSSSALTKNIGGLPAELETWGKGFSSKSGFINPHGDAASFMSSGEISLGWEDSGGGRRFWQRKLLGNVKYCDEDDDTFRLGRVHRDEGVLPKKYRSRILNTYSNYIRVERGEGGGGWQGLSTKIRYCNTFIISSWWPGASKNFNKPMMVTYNEKDDKEIRRATVADEKYRGERSGTPATTASDRTAEGFVENKHNHPKLELGNLTITLLLGYALQGAQNAYYCGNWTTPGNGHDLSLLSDKAARDDFVQMSRLMNLGASSNTPIWTLAALMVFLFATLLVYL
eukprot:jgi/Bigna1/75094/fgenesh1_pg.32_\